MRAVLQPTALEAALRRTWLVALVALCACKSAPSFEGLAPALDQGGPKVAFDLAHRPLPEIPFPNDLATRPDPTSPTGLRVNASLIAPSQLERGVRGMLDTLDGFGTFAPITVAFDQPLDVLDLYNRQNNADPADDGVYLVDLVSGQTVQLDFNGGHYPLTLSSPDQYFRNDPQAATHNLLFPVTGPFANFLHPGAPHAALRDEVDDLLTFYERSTNTLILRPVVPLLQEHKYAVVLTTRLRGTSGKPISSPHSGINHAALTRELQPLLTRLPAGLQLADIAYTWPFTTQSTTRDLETIRQGLHGFGPLRQLAVQYPVQAGLGSLAGQSSYQSVFTLLQERGVVDPANPSKNFDDYRLPADDLKKLLQDPDIKKLLLGSDEQEVQALLDTFAYVDYFVQGTFESPSFLDTKAGEPADQSFQLDRANGTARTQGEKVTFILAVPKARPEVGHVAPFPTVIAGHGYKSIRIEHILGFAGTFAKFGLATISIDAFGHGIGLDPLLELFGRTKARAYGLGAFADAVFTGRARDLDYDGVKDSGGDFWTADTFHTRDVVRQSVVDWMQLIRLLRSFDGQGKMLVAGGTAVAGDFNNDGIPDVGGPVTWPAPLLSKDDGKTHVFEAGTPDTGSDLFVFGISLGGILSAVLPAVEPTIVAAAPTSGAGGLGDVGIRSTLDQVVQAVFLELFGPLFATCDFSQSSGPLDPQTGQTVGECNSGAAVKQPTLVLVVQDVNRERDLPIAPLTLAPGDRVMVRNLAQTTATADCSAEQKIDGCSIATADA